MGILTLNISREDIEVTVVGAFIDGVDTGDDYFEPTTYTDEEIRTHVVADLTEKGWVIN